MDILLYVITFGAGTLFGFLLRAWATRRTYDGVIRVIDDEINEKTLYSLELADDPENLVDKREVIFKVETSEEEADRE